MRISISLPGFASDGYRVPPSRLESFAQQAENNGFARLWQSDHLINPPTYSTSFLDPLTTLASIAEVTEHIPLGTSLVILPLRDPVWVAKRAATLQHLSEGRLSLGVGLGYVQEEFDAVDIPIEERSPRFTEGVELLAKLFSQETVTFEGEFYDLDSFRLEPPCRRPPDLLVGGGNVDPDKGVPRSLKERVRLADGWISPPNPPETIDAIWSEISEYIESHNGDPKDIERIHLVQLHLVPDSNTSDAVTEQLRVFEEFRTITRFADDRKGAREWLRSNCVVGNVADVRDELRRLAESGTDEVILQPITGDLACLDEQLSLWTSHLLPQFQ